MAMTELEKEIAEVHMEGEKETGARRVVGIKELVDSGLHSVPPIYVRPPHERPDLSEHIAPSLRIPVIDLAHLHDDDDDARSSVIRELGRACDEWGFFQVRERERFILDQYADVARSYTCDLIIVSKEGIQLQTEISCDQLDV